MIISLFKTPLGQLRIVGFLEGLSFLVLLGIAMPLKYIAGFPEAVRIVGMAHGILFIVYIFYAIIVKFERSWSNKILFLAVLASFIPLGTFVADAKIFRHESRRDF